MTSHVVVTRFAMTGFLAISLLLASLAWAVELAPDAPQTYTVRQGDTLWKIAEMFITEPWRWSEVWQARAGDDPNLIYPGDVLQSSLVAGKPRVSILRSGSAPAGHDGMRVVRLSPKVRESSLTTAVPTIKIGAIEPFLTQPYVADSDQIKLRLPLGVISARGT